MSTSSNEYFDLRIILHPQVGAGPTGLVAALTLLRNGVRVRIIEKDAEHHRGERGFGIMVGEKHYVTLIRS